MKKIIYSIVVALYVSIILVLLFPTWFLRGDARWTHLNDAARVDIYFEGKQKNGRVRVEGADIKISHPKFLSINGSQGAAVEIPVSYWTRSYQIKLTPQADEWGKDAAIIVKFLGQHFQYGGKRRPAWVAFRNIALNGKSIAKEREVWHDQHFVQKYPLHSSNICTLTFDVHKPLAASDIFFVNVAALFFASLLLSLFFALSTRVANFLNEINNAENSEKKGKRIYFVEFLRVYMILSVFLVHVGEGVDGQMWKDIMEFFGTSRCWLGFAVQPFFIIGGFFLYGRLAKEETVNVFASMGKLWMRLMPGIIFCFVILVILGARDWWQFPLCLFPAAGYGLLVLLVGFADWFVGVYFVTSCLFTMLFATSRRSAWLLICILTFVCWLVYGTVKPDSALMFGGMYYGFLTPRLALGIGCMGLGMAAGHLSAHWKPRMSIFLRWVATTIEVLALFMLFNIMYRTSVVHYHYIAVPLVTALLLISAAHGWGYISAFLNRFSGIMYVSRYTYSLLLIQGMLVYYFVFNHNFGMDAHTCSFIIFTAAVPLVLIEYHIIEKWLTPVIKRALTRECT